MVQIKARLKRWMVYAGVNGPLAADGGRLTAGRSEDGRSQRVRCV